MQAKFTICLLLGMVSPWQLQAATLSGQVLDQDTLQPLPFALVSLQGQSIQLETDATGIFSVDSPNPQATLVAAKQGYFNNSIKAIMSPAAGLENAGIRSTIPISFCSSSLMV